MTDQEKKPGALQIFLIFLRLGLTSFGGPVAHLGFFRDEFVHHRRWLSERSYADLVALCQFLPGPASSQVGMALGLSRAGYAGAAAAWLGFTLPSAVLLIVLALGVNAYDGLASAGFLHGLKIAAVAVVAQAVWGMGRNLCPDMPRILLMTVAAGIVLTSSAAWAQVAVIAAAGLVGLALFKPEQNAAGHDDWTVPVGRTAGMVWLVLFAVGLLALPVLAATFQNQSIQLIDAFYRAGALVFGGGHVVLPLLQAEVVPTGWVDEEVFLAGYGAAQAVPGPLFSFAAFLGAAMKQSPTAWVGGLLCLLAVFTPSFLLVAGALPFWENLRRNQRIQAALMGVNAAVVGILLAALYNPVWTSAIDSLQDFILALLALAALVYWRLPSWAVVALCAISSAVLTTIAA